MSTSLFIFAEDFEPRYSYASCAAPLFGPPGPCFDSFMVSADSPLTERSIMENYARNIESGYPDWQMSDREWGDDTPLQLPAIICTEFVADGMKHYRMAKWVDSHTISSFENHRDDSLCDKWLAPIDDGVKIRWDKPNYLSNDVGILRVTDREMNQDDKNMDSFDIHVWSDTDHAGINLTITETGIDSGVFEGTVFFTPVGKSGDNRLLVEDAVYADYKFSVGSAKIIREYKTQHDENTWYLGENLEKGDFVSYKLCHWDYNDCQEFQMDIWIDGDMILETEPRWTAQVTVTDGDDQVQGSIELGKVSAEPFGRNDGIKPYRDAFGSSVAWLASSTSEISPGSLASGEFIEHDKWVPTGIVPHTFSAIDSQKILVPAGSFDVTVLQSDIIPQNMIWVADDIPFPVKAEVYLDRVCDSGCPLEYGFELLDYSKNMTYGSFIAKAGQPHAEYLSPLKQFKNGTPFDEIKCDKNMRLTQKYDGTPACVSSETYPELIKRGWISDIIIAVQSRDVFMDTEDELSSYMDRAIPTLADFNELLEDTPQIDTILSKLGQPHDDIGSGIHIYVYELNDKTQIWVGYVEDIWYVRHVDSAGNLIEDLFAKPSEPNAFANGVTEIINPEHEPLKYTKTIQVIDDTYLSKNVEQWQDVSREYMESEHEKYGDEFYIELGKLLIKNEFQKQMNSLGIENANDDFDIFNGMMLTSLPPHIQYTSVVLGNDSNYYRLEGTTYANQVSFYATKQLQFPDTAVPLSVETIVDENRLFTILPEDGNKPRQDPFSLVIHTNDSTVEFFNNTPETIRIQDSGSGVIGEEHTLSWIGPTIMPYQRATMSFDEPGLVEWDARIAPSLEESWWWSTHAGGNIIVLSDDMDNLPVDRKLKMAQAIVHTQDLPIMGSGSGNAQKALTIDLDHAVVAMVPDAKQYYLERIQQIIPFDVKVIIE